MEKLKPVICILNPDDIFYLKHYSNCTDSLPYCVTIKDVKDLQKREVEIEDNLCKENIILTQLPGQNKYIFRKPEDENRMIENRIKTIGDILSYLGAKSCNISYSSSNKSDNNYSVDVNANANVHGKANVSDVSTENGTDVEVDVKVDKSQVSVNEMDLLSENQWPGNYTEEGYKRAKEIAFEARLDDDPGIKSLLEQRNPCHPNPVSSNHYKIELYSSMKKSLEIATKIQSSISNKLNLPVGTSAEGTINAGLEVNITKNDYAENREFMDMQITFGPFVSKKASVTQIKEASTLPQSSSSRQNSTNKLIAIIIGSVTLAVGVTIAAMKFIM